MTDQSRHHRGGPAPSGTDPAPARRRRVEFLIDGVLSEVVLAAFPELRAGRGPAGGTALYGTVCDEAHLQGLFARFANLAVPVMEMRRLPDD